MVRFTSQWLNERLARERIKDPQGATGEKCAASGTEIKSIHEPIIRWCNSQHPRPAVIRSRPDKETGCTPGAPDFVIFWRRRAILVEAKAKGGKLSKDQQEWFFLANLNGFDVHICRSFEQFLEIVEEKPVPPQG